MRLRNFFEVATRLHSGRFLPKKSRCRRTENKRTIRTGLKTLQLEKWALETFLKCFHSGTYLPKKSRFSNKQISNCSQTAGYWKQRMYLKTLKWEGIENFFQSAFTLTHLFQKIQIDLAIKNQHFSWITGNTLYQWYFVTKIVPTYCEKKLF